MFNIVIETKSDKNYLGALHHPLQGRLTVVLLLLGGNYGQFEIIGISPKKLRIKSF